MQNEGDFSNIADPTFPNAGRIYDYLIGGHHNFEIDRKAAKQLLEVAPFMPHALRLIRWFLGEATRRLVAEGYDNFLDFASGLPAADHIHELAPAGTKVIYSDLDPVTVQYAHDLLKDNPDVRYVQCDAGNPQKLLNSGVVEELFGDNRKVAIGFNGVAYFLTDDRIQQAFHTLYDWAGEGSKLFFCDADANVSETSEKLQPVFELYSQVGQPIHIRSQDKLRKMAEPWQVCEPGFLTLDEWLGIGKKVTEKETSEWGGRGFYGVILHK